MTHNSNSNRASRGIVDQVNKSSRKGRSFDAQYAAVTDAFSETRNALGDCDGRCRTPHKLAALLLEKMDRPVRIRTITFFTPHGSKQLKEGGMSTAAKFLNTAQKRFEQNGYEVQSVRIATPPILDFSQPSSYVVEEVKSLQECSLENGISFINVGPANHPSATEKLGEVLKQTSSVSCSYAMPKDMTLETAMKVSRCILNIATITEGRGNFMFCVSANCHPGIPYFPVGSGDGKMGFAIGTENDAILPLAFKGCAGDLEAARESLKKLLTIELKKLEEISTQVERELGVPYMGIDTSLAPGLDTPPLTKSFEMLGLGKFGESGTLSCCSAITSALKSIAVKQCGYSGLMLPVCEDTGLAEAAIKGDYSINDLLYYSTVCGCGLDCVPVPGYTQDPKENAIIEGKMARVLIDLTAIAFRLDKPLSCRFLPQPGKRPGDLTKFNNQYLVDSAVFPL